MITSFLVIIFFSWLIFFFAEGNKKKYSAKKKKLLTNKRSYSSNGNTFMPMIWSFYANPFLYFLGVPKTFLKCWGFLLRTNNKTNFNDVCSVCTPTPKIEILMISAAVHWKYIPNTEGPPFWHHVFMPTPIKNFSGWLKHFFFVNKIKKSITS